MKVDKAWTYSAGDSVNVGLTDTGIHPGQPELTSAFATGHSAGPRWVQHLHEVDNPDITCSHGTHMGGTIAAPMNGTGVAGVAWRANLISVHVANWVAGINEINAQQGIRTTGNRGAKVVSMGWQSVDFSNTVEDEIRFWYYNRDVMFVGAAGTGDCDGPINEGNVIFPAEMAEVLAVSAADVVDGHRPCHAHYGWQLDIVAYHHMPTTPYVVGGPLEATSQSSNATAVVTGIAALVRARYPYMTNLQVMDRLVATAEPVSGGQPGCGLLKAWARVVNALVAVGGVCVPPISGSDAVGVTVSEPSKTTAYSVSPSGGVGPYAYEWSNGSTASTTTYTFWLAPDYRDYYTEIWVKVWDLGKPDMAYELRRKRVEVNYIRESPDDPCPPGEVCPV